MKLTIIQPCLGRRIGSSYIRSWQMEPLAPAVLAGLTPSSVEVKFYDDRMEAIPFDEPTDLVAMSVETFTAKRAYQIASEYRRRRVPVVMGGFHATLAPNEVSQYAESVVIGEAEKVWSQVIDDLSRSRLQRVYRDHDRPALNGLTLDRSIFCGKRYLPIGLVEAARGCRLRCEFCAIQSYYNSTQTWRPTEEVIAEVRHIEKPLIFFVDDNITSDSDRAKDLFGALIPLGIRWVGQASIHAAFDEELLQLIRASGCQGLLIGLETLDPDNLRSMRKTFNRMKGGYEEALANLRRHGIRLYVTFLLGYDHDTEDAIDANLEFALKHRLFIVSFNHLTPFPGTPLYQRLELEGRLLFDRWWLDPHYRYGMVPFVPKGMTPEAVERGCFEARSAFYSFRSILRRGADWRVNCRGPFMGLNFFIINLLMRRELLQRKGYPLGDEAFTGPLIKVEHEAAPDLMPFQAEPSLLGSGVG